MILYLSGINVFRTIDQEMNYVCNEMYEYITIFNILVNTIAAWANHQK